LHSDDRICFRVWFPAVSPVSCLNDLRRKEFQQRSEMPPAAESRWLCLPQYTVSLLNLLLRTSLGSDDRICFRVLLPCGISDELPK